MSMRQLREQSYLNEVDRVRMRTLTRVTLREGVGAILGRRRISSSSPTRPAHAGDAAAEIAVCRSSLDHPTRIN